MIEMSTSTVELKNQLNVARNELKNIRQQMIGLKKDHERNVKQINEQLHSYQHNQLCMDQKHLPTIPEDTSVWSFKPVGYIESIFNEKNGTPRQAAICQESRATLTISQEVFTNPHHSLAGLELFSHIWILFVFHKNKGQYSGATVRPPRLNGAKMGLFATRSPHRPNPVGLTLARVEKIEGSVIYLLGVDMTNGTPVIDIKPYIPQYDMPWNLETSLSGSGNISVKQREQQHSTDYSAASLDEMLALNLPDVEVNSCGSSDNNRKVEILPAALASDQISDTSLNTVGPEVSVAKWITSYLQSTLSVIFTARAEEQLNQFDSTSLDRSFQLRHLHNAGELKSALTAVLQADPRSVYRRKHCHNQLYYVTVDVAHVTCWFDVDVVEVLKVQSLLVLQKENNETV